jgi:hypothetical protein
MCLCVSSTFPSPSPSRANGIGAGRERARDLCRPSLSLLPPRVAAPTSPNCKTSETVTPATRAACLPGASERASVCVCVRACVRACVCVCVGARGRQRRERCGRRRLQDARRETQGETQAARHAAPDTQREARRNARQGVAKKTKGQLQTRNARQGLSDMWKPREGSNMSHTWTYRDRCPTSQPRDRLPWSEIQSWCMRYSKYLAQREHFPFIVNAISRFGVPEEVEERILLCSHRRVKRAKKMNIQSVAKKKKGQRRKADARDARNNDRSCLSRANKRPKPLNPRP